MNTKKMGKIEQKMTTLKGKNRTTFQKTETLLYNYNNFRAVIEDKMKQIEMIRQEGVPQRSSSVTYYSAGHSCEVDMDKAEKKILEIEKNIEVTKSFVELIDNALETLKNDQYYDIIPLKYFEKNTHEYIAEQLDVETSTISRNKNRLVKMLQIRLFSDEVILELLT